MQLMQHSQPSSCPTWLVRPNLPVERIKRPNYPQLKYAAYTFHLIATEEKISFAFAGTFGSRISAPNQQHDFDVYVIEILMEPIWFLNERQALWDLARRRKELGITSEKDMVALVWERAGVALKLVALGTEGYPDKFVPPYESSHYTREHFISGMEPTFFTVNIGSGGHPIAVPVIQGRLGFLQKLLRIDPDDETTEIENRNENDISAIKAFLDIAVDRRDPPFPLDVVRRLQRKLDKLIPFAAMKGMSLKEKDLRNLRRIGFNVTQWQCSPSETETARTIETYPAPQWWEEILPGGQVRLVFLNP